MDSGGLELGPIKGAVSKQKHKVAVMVDHTRCWQRRRQTPLQKASARELKSSKHQEIIKDS